MTLPVPDPSVLSVGDLLTASIWNDDVVNAVKFLANPPIFLGVQATGQALANSTKTAITLDTETVDTYDGHSTSSNTSRYTAQVAGWYELVGSVSFPANSTGRREIGFMLNGSDILLVDDAVASTDIAPVLTWLVELAVDDYVELTGFQSSGGSLTLSTASKKFSWMSVRWVHA